MEQWNLATTNIMGNIFWEICSYVVIVALHIEEELKEVRLFEDVQQ